MRKMKDSGIEWIGQIPSDWDTKKCKYITTFINGFPFESERLKSEYLYPVIRISDIQDGSISLDDCLGIDSNYGLASYLIKNGDILLAMSGATVGKVGIVKGDVLAYINQRVGIIRTGCPSFLFYCLSTKNFVEYVMLMSAGTAQPNVSTKGFGEYPVPFPPLAKQQRIADFLDEKCGEIDSIRSDVQREIEILNDYKKSVITEAVTKGLNPKAKLKDSGIEWIGKIPEEWNVKKLKFYFTFGKGLPITKENLQDTGVPVISYGQIHSKQNSGTAVNDTLIRFVNESYLRTNPSSLVHQNDFIFADTSEDLDGCGNCVYVDTKGPLFAGYHAIIFRSLQPNAKYFAYLFLTDCWRSQIRKVASGVKLYSITQKILKETSVIIPPLSEQKAIADYLDEKCSEIDATIVDKQKQLETLDEYKKSLIFEYVTGKKEVLQ